MPKTEISLLPEEVKEKRVEETLLVRLKKVGLIFLLISILMALGSLFYFLTLTNSLNQTKESINDLEQKIASLQTIEETADDVEKRSAALKSIFANEIYYSKLLAALSEATNSDVAILELTSPSAKSANISGSARSYASLAKFLLALKSETAAETIFDKVELKEVSLDQQTGLARFSVLLSLHEGALSQDE